MAAYLIFFALIVLTPFAIAQSEPKGKNYTPGSVKNKLNSWGERIAVPRAKHADVKDIWYSNYTDSVSGYVAGWGHPASKTVAVLIVSF